MNRKSRREQVFFDLIWWSVALLVIGVVGGFIRVNVFGERGQANRRSARLDIRILSQAVESFRQKHSRLPESLDQLVPGEVARLRPDPWGKPYLFTHSGDTFQVSSSGPDKMPGGGDDISIEDAEKS